MIFGYLRNFFKPPEPDWDLVEWAVIQTESGGDPMATSPSGAQGLMQLMPGTGLMLARQIGEFYNPFNPKQNVKLGMMYLKQLYKSFGDLDLALTAYHSGPSRVRRLLRETKGKKLNDIIHKLGPAGQGYAATVHKHMSKKKKA